MTGDGTSARTRHALSVAAPFRLDLVVSALRRLSSNVVDVLTADGQYVRVLDLPHGHAIVRANQSRDDTLAVTIAGDPRDHASALARVRCMLGVDRDLAHFDRAATRIPWLAPLARRMRGLRPPRYPSLWEACVNAIVFQQVSIQAASAITRRLVVALEDPVEHEGVSLHPFPSAERLLNADDRMLRATGLSAGKLATLRRVGEAIGSGALEATTLEERTSGESATALQQIKGVGPWTATVILLRGLGRLDVFPMRDSSVARNLALVGGPEAIDVPGVLDALRPQQGMLYYHLLLARLEARGEVERASISDRAP
jgi:DNA-3-methyladenine glycosylase II